MMAVQLRWGVVRFSVAFFLFCCIFFLFWWGQSKEEGVGVFEYLPCDDWVDLKNYNYCYSFSGVF